MSKYWSSDQGRQRTIGFRTCNFVRRVNNGLVVSIAIPGFSKTHISSSPLTVIIIHFTIILSWRYLKQFNFVKYQLGTYIICSWAKHREKPQTSTTTSLFGSSWQSKFFFYKKRKKNRTLPLAYLWLMSISQTKCKTKPLHLHSTFLRRIFFFTKIFRQINAKVTSLFI